MTATDFERRGVRFLAPGQAGMALLLVLAGGTAFGQTSDGRPDFTGIWFPAGTTRAPDPLPFTPAAEALLEQFVADFETEDDPGRYCIWPGMPRAPWGAPFAVEVIHRDHDLTIIWEGYGMYRKIYMADRNPPEAILPSAMGHSLAHWEGDTLVIETTDLRPYPYMNRLPTTSNAHIVERLRIEEREVDGETRIFLVDEITLADPQLYTEPVRIRAQAVLRNDLSILEYTCSVTLWEEYLESRGLELPDVDGVAIP